MNIVALKTAYLVEQVTSKEVETKLAFQLPPDLASATILDAWDDIKSLQAELKDARERAGTPRLERSTVTELIDHAFLSDHIGWQTATNYLIAAGVRSKIADHHITTLDTIRKHEAERDAYLADPDNAPRYCTRCGQQTTANKLSQRSICETCGFTASQQAVLQLQTHQGPVYRKWRDSMITAMYRLENELIAERSTEPPLVLGDFLEPTVDNADENEADPSRWICPACNFRNAETDSECFYCNEPKPRPF